MACIGRYTSEKYAQHFGDGRHKFYLEFRCNAECEEGKDRCEKCEKITNGPVVQYFRTFNHGNVNEPLPDRSHIYGGKWYFNVIKKWGAPPSEIIEFAIQYQKEARKGFIVEQPNYELSKDEKQYIPQEMPRAKDAKKIDKDADPNTTAPIVKPVKQSRKPKIAPETSKINETNETNEPIVTIQQIKEAKANKKPKIATEVSSEPKKRAPRKKAVETPKNNTSNELSHKEVSLPTHIEKEMEEIDSEGYQIEYIQLTVFEANGSTYFRDSKKNKLYKKIKEKGIGPYVGRWNPNTESIITNIPDSDNEE
jgi:hypothetical protein